MEKIKVLQQIKVSDKASIYIVGFNRETKVLKFRTSYEPKQLHEESVEIVDDKVITNLYNFNIGYLNNFLVKNSI